MKDYSNWLKSIHKEVRRYATSGNSSDAAINLLKQLDAIDKYGYIKSALTDDPLMRDVLLGEVVEDWLLDSHKGEFRENLEEMLAYWFFDRHANERDSDLTSMLCLVVVDRFCGLNLAEHVATENPESLLLRHFKVPFEPA